MRGIKITEEVYMRVKKQLRYHKSFEVARRNELSEMKVLKIKASTNFHNFEQITRAEHPPENESSLGKRVLKLEEKFNKLAQAVLPWELW